MTPQELIQNKELYKKIHVIANGLRFRILELTQGNQLSITELSSSLNLSYTKCADYVKMLEQQKLITKTKLGKEVKVASKVKMTSKGILF